MGLVVRELKGRKLWLVSRVLKLKTPKIEHFQTVMRSMEVSYQSQKEVEVVKELKVKCTSIHPRAPQSCHN